MKTEYLILWVDDQLSTVDSDREDIEEHLESVGIKAIYEAHEAKRDINIHDVILPTLQKPELDLLVVDYRMPGIDGRQLIEQIRSTDHIFLPVIFYSNDGVDALMDAARQTGLEGVYYAHRNQLVAKIKEVTSSLLSKEQTIKRTRGLLMEGLSEIDASFHSLALKAWGKLSAEKKNQLVAYFKKKMEEKLKRANELYGKVPSNTAELEKVIKDDFMTVAYDTMTRWKLLKKLLELSGVDTAKLSVYKEISVKNDNAPTLISTRNDYAHKTRAQLEPAHNHDKCVQIRKELRKHLGNVKAIAEEP